MNGFPPRLVASLVRFREWRVRDDFGNSGRRRRRPGIPHRRERNVDADRHPPRPDAARGPDRPLLWSDQYRITLSNWFEAQQAIVRRIAVGLNIHLSASRLSRLTAEHGASPHAYDRWLRAQEMILKYSPPAWAQATEIFPRRSPTRRTSRRPTAVWCRSTIPLLLSILAPSARRNATRSSNSPSGRSSSTR